MNNDHSYKRIQIKRSAQRDPFPTRDDRSHLHINAGLLTGTLRGTITVLTPLHVGTGQLMRIADLKPAPLDVPPDTELTAAFFREDNRLVVPGSSIKGVFRHLYEAVTPSCMAQAHRQHRPPEDLKPCYYRADSRQGFQRIELCPACRVFGAQGYMGQVYFHTAYPTDDARTRILFAPSRWEPKIRPEQAYTRKFYTHEISSSELVEPLEVLPSETLLNFSMDFRNLLPTELGLLLLVMGQGEPTIYPKLGGAKAHGFGGVEVTVDAIDFLTQEDYLSYTPMSISTTDFAGYVAAAQADTDLFDANVWRQIAELLAVKPEGFDR